MSVKRIRSVSDPAAIEAGDQTDEYSEHRCNAVRDQAGQ